MIRDISSRYNDVKNITLQAAYERHDRRRLRAKGVDAKN
jgi:hypothetical protein